MTTPLNLTLNLNQQERDLYEGIDLDGRTILEWTLKK